MRKTQYMRIYLAKSLCVFCSWVALTTILIFLFGFERRGSLSEYVIDPLGKEVFTTGFSLASVGFLTYKRFFPSFVFLMGIIHVTVYEAQLWHNLLSLAFFLYTAFVMRWEGEKRLFYLTLATAILVPISLFWFEVIAIMLIILYTLKRNKNILS